MDNLLLSLGLGVGLMVTASGLLVWFTRFSATQAAVLVALAALGIYLPAAALHWPGGDVFAIHLAVYSMTAYLCGLFFGLREKDRSPGEPSVGRFHWGPAVIAGFFILLLAVNSVFILLAQRGLGPSLSDELLPGARHRGHVSSAFPGVVSHDFQEKEEQYNRYLAQAERQQERGWQIRKGWLGEPVAGEPATFKVTARTRQGEPLTGAEVMGQFLRPSDSHRDTAFTMHEAEPGVYLADLELPAAGLWNLVLRLRKGDERHEIRATTSVAAR